MLIHISGLNRSLFLQVMWVTGSSEGNQFIILKMATVYSLTQFQPWLQPLVASYSNVRNDNEFIIWHPLKDVTTTL